jgi:hypothetical protein
MNHVIFSEYTQEPGAVIGVTLFTWIDWALVVVYVVGFWKTFTKAGRPGWGAIIPIYNVILLLEIAERPLWWIVLLLIPFVNIVVIIMVSIDVAKNFGKSSAFGIGLTFLGFIFYPILGFGDAKYQGSAPSKW